LNFIDQIEPNWTLFLDRDGVINKWLPGSYVASWGMFEFEPGSINALKVLAQKFKYIIIVTNQRGIYKGIMSARDLDNVHDRMLDEIEANGGRIDQIFYCPHDNGHPDRKPATGMLDKAKKEFPSIDFSKSIMIGDKNSDMEMAKSAGIYTVMVNKHDKHNDALIDIKCENLMDFAKLLV